MHKKFLRTFTGPLIILSIFSVVCGTLTKAVYELEVSTTEPFTSVRTYNGSAVWYGTRTTGTSVTDYGTSRIDTISKVGWRTDGNTSHRLWKYRAKERVTKGNEHPYYLKFIERDDRHCTTPLGIKVFVEEPSCCCGRTDRLLSFLVLTEGVKVGESKVFTSDGNADMLPTRVKVKRS